MVVSALWGFVVFLVVHVIGFRYVRPRRAAPTIVVSAGVGLGAALAALLRGAGGTSMPLASAPPGTVVVCAVVAGGIYGMLLFHYMVWVFVMGEAAIRLRLLRVVEASSTRAATLGEIYHAYNADVIVRTRLARLVESGHLAAVEGACFTSGKRTLWIHSAVMKAIETLTGAKR